MEHHKTNVVGHGDAWQAKCVCRWRSQVLPLAEVQKAEDAHHQDVQRAQAGLRSSTPSLGSLRTYYQDQADNTANDPEERALWQQLADELGPFIKPKSDAHQLNLWE